MPGPAEVLNLLTVAKDVVANPAAGHKGSLSGVNHMLKGRPEPGGGCLGQQLAVAVEEGDRAVVVQQGPRPLALVHLRDDPP